MFYINLNVICVIQIISATLLVISISALKNRASAVGTHVRKVATEFQTPKCQGKLDCLIREMLFIRERKPKLNTQSDSTRAKVFV